MRINLFKKYLFLHTAISLILLNIDTKEAYPQEEIIWEKIKTEKSINKSNQLIWEIYEGPNYIDSEKSINKSNQLIWEIYEGPNYIDSENSYKRDSITNFFDSRNKRDSELIFLDYGSTVISANSIPKNNLRIEIGQVSPFIGGEAGGTGNQNYFSRIYYGIDDTTDFSIFFTEADDPLYSQIASRSNQTSNLWTNFGVSFKKILYEKNKYKLGFETSIERWRVKSGGCNGFGCDKTKLTNNIFNNNLETVDNTNTISSIALAFTRKFNKDFEYTISPKFTFLPSYQNKGEFFGNNFGIGLGGKYAFNKKFRLYNSIYVPIAFENNNFDDQLKYQKKIINTIGASFSFDPETTLEAYLSNSFGSSPATSILTLPSANELMLGGRLIYTPKFNRENYLRRENENKKHFEQQSFLPSSLLKRGTVSLDYGLLNKNSDFYNLRLGLTQSFNLDFSSELINSKNKKYKKFTDNYLDSGIRSARGGGTLKVFSQERGDLISTNFRLSFGRSMGEIRNGYMFGEIINKYSKNESLSFNLTPKFSITGNGNIYSIVPSLNLKLNPRIELIPEANIGLQNSDNNFSLTGRTYLSEKIIIDSFISNSFGMIDMAKQFKSESPKYGVKLKLIF